MRERRAAAVPLDHGRRVPGHEPPAVRARRSAARRPGRAGRLLRRRRVPVDLRLPARRRRRSSASGARPRRSALPLTRNYRSRPEVLAAVNHLFQRGVRRGLPAARRVRASSRIPVFGHPVELLVTDKASYREAGAHWRRARRRRSRGACASSSTRARRRPARSCCSSRPAPTPSGTRRRCAPQGLPTYRATGRGYFGQQQVVDLLSYLRLLHNRYDDEALAAVLASPFVGVSNDALVLIRRHASKRPLYTGIERSLPERALRARRAPGARVQAALRAARRSLGAPVARAALRGDRLRARLRPRGARAVGREAPLREPAQADAARALVRGAARRRTSRASSSSSATRRRSARRSSRPSRRRREPTRCAC